jgi:hypothetical protein
MFPVLTHFSFKPIDRLIDVDGPAAHPWKPPGLWLAVKRLWLDYATGSSGLGVGRYEYRAELHPDAQILVVRTIGDLDALPRLADGDLVDWASVMLGYDGVYIPDFHDLRHHIFVNSAGMMRHMWALSCDVDSMCIWKPSAAVSRFWLHRDHGKHFGRPLFGKV